MTAQRDADDYLMKAHESLASAEADFAAGRFNSCMNRCYYACFQAAVATLVQVGSISGQSTHEHHFIHSAFVVLITRRKMYPSRLGSALPKLVSKRRLADYRTTKISGRDARHSVEIARDFVSAVKARMT